MADTTNINDLPGPNNQQANHVVQQMQQQMQPQMQQQTQQQMQHSHQQPLQHQNSSNRVLQEREMQKILLFLQLPVTGYVSLMLMI